MKAIEFPEQTTVYAKEQPQYRPLPSWRGPGPEHLVVTCWQLSWTERVKLLGTGKIWWSQLTFGDPLQTVREGQFKTGG